MPRRLVIPVIACAALLALADDASPGGAAAPSRGIHLDSPAHFVLPKKPVRIPLGARAVHLARKQLGVPYRWGGSSPSGFDCSGLVSWVYGRLGVGLPHNAAALYSVGRPVSLAHMMPGDLVFFHGLGHVGIYIGHGRMIHAPRSGEHVEIQALAQRSGAVEGARRVART